MPFFDTKQNGKTKRTHASPFDLECAQYLTNLIIENRRNKGPIKQNLWALQFTRLRLEGFSEDHIKGTLTWYANHLQSKYTPYVSTAKVFREKYLNIQEAIERGAHERVTEITIRAKSIQKDLPGFTWPEGITRDAELRFIQLSLNGHAEYRRLLDAAMRATKTSLYFKSLLGHLLTLEKEPENFVTVWAWRIHRWSCSVLRFRPDFTFELEQKAFHFKQPLFEERGPIWCRDYTGKAYDWIKVKELLDDAGRTK